MMDNFLPYSHFKSWIIAYGFITLSWLQLSIGGGCGTAVHVIIQLQRGQEIPATRNIDLGGIDVIVINILVAAHYLWELSCKY